jgi:hypothetical protein
MKVELRQAMIRVPGPSLPAGSVIDVPDEEGTRLLAKRIAIPANDKHPSSRSQQPARKAGKLDRETRP